MFRVHSLSLRGAKRRGNPGEFYYTIGASLDWQMSRNEIRNPGLHSTLINPRKYIF